MMLLRSYSKIINNNYRNISKYLSSNNNKNNYKTDLITNDTKTKSDYGLSSIIIDNDEKIRNSSIQGYSETSLLINNQTIHQPIIAFKNIYLLWDINDFNDITIESLSIVFVHHPTVEVLLIGLGHKPKRISKEITDFYRSKGIVIDSSSTFNACSTYNILLAEDRNVAIAVVPDEFFSNEK